MSSCHEMLCAPAMQLPLASKPFDSWTEPGGSTVAYFYRVADGILVRFPDVADFLVDADAASVRALPVSEAARPATETLLANSIRPLVDNHRGSVNLHGSAACIAGLAAAFVGVSRSGKTTLAGALARAGYPLLTEDVLALTGSGGAWQVLPRASPLRLFPDSAQHLRGEPLADPDDGRKIALPDWADLPRSLQPSPLAGIYLLGDGSSRDVRLSPLEPAQGLALLLRHAFILDVEDKPRVAAHFARLADLAGDVACCTLDFPRRYDILPHVIEAVVEDIACPRPRRA